MAIHPNHVTNAAIARERYLNGLTPAEATADWHFAVREARRSVADALRASRYLLDIPMALTASGEHTLVFRQMLAPPVSQDQFLLMCPSYSKSAEKSKTPYRREAAQTVANSLAERIDLGVASWQRRGEIPKRREVELFLRVLSTLIGAQRLSTARRTRLSFEQEYAVINMLEQNGWILDQSRLVQNVGVLPSSHFMHKTLFATGTTSPQEVDIACGVGGTYVLAMECKVTNDETNSIKRVNDVIKKAEAWQTHWGNFVKTAALLQGVIRPMDVQRLTDRNIHVFWSHDLNSFQQWLVDEVARNR